jgi:predicted aspartyl protease
VTFLRPAPLLLLLASCASSALYGHVNFPSVAEPRWTVPLLSPLESPSAYALAELEGAPGPDGQPRRTTVEVKIDTGAARTSIPRSILESLGLEVFVSRNHRIIDASGYMSWAEGGKIPRVRLGTLLLEDVPVDATANSFALIGYDLLSQYPVEIDLDRAIMTIGAAPWAKTASVVAVPIKKHGSHSATVRVGLDGKEALFYLDTGADSSSIDFESADGLGLRRKALERVRSYSGALSSGTVSQLYAVDKLEIGGRSVGSRELWPLPKKREGGALNEKVIGLLGMDILGCSRIRMDFSEEKVELGARTTVAERIRDRLSRWSWAAECGSEGGCIQVDKELADGNLELRVRASKHVPRAAAYTLACAEGSNGPALDPTLPLLVLRMAALEPGIDLKVRPAPSDASFLERMIGNSSRCSSFTVVDVNPEAGNVAGTVRLLPASPRKCGS